MTDEQEKLTDLKRRACKLGHQVEPSVQRLGYCLWRTWPGGRFMILGRNDGVALDAIEQKLDEIEAAKHKAANDPVPAQQSRGPCLALARSDASAAAAKPRSSPRRRAENRRRPSVEAIDGLGEAEIAQLYGNRRYA